MGGLQGATAPGNRGPGSHPCPAGVGRANARGQEQAGLCKASTPRWKPAPQGLAGSLKGCLTLPAASLGHRAGAHRRRAGLSRLAAAAGLADAELRVGRVPNLA